MPLEPNLPAFPAPACFEALAGLPPAKAAIAMRLAAAGRPLSAAEFRRRGQDLSACEERTIRLWEVQGLSSAVVERARSADGSVRLAVALADGERVEALAMPVGAACLSTQVGCAVGCLFCASGSEGLRRNLGPQEIFEQLLHARREMPIARVVFMGIGEPTHNLENVLAAVACLRAHALISPARQTLSTVGSINAFERMSRAPVRPCLALSLHAAEERKRRRLLPRAPAESLPELVAAAGRYMAGVKLPVQFEWTLLAGINDTDEDLRALEALVAGVRGYVNFLIWNPVPGMPFAPTPRPRALELVRRLRERGILATIREATGADVGAACGQLRRSRPAGATPAEDA